MLFVQVVSFYLPLSFIFVSFKDPSALFTCYQIGPVMLMSSKNTDTSTAIFVNTVKNLHAFDEIEAQHPLKGIGQPSDIVGAAIFLASSEASWITGVCLPVDGGFTAR